MIHNNDLYFLYVVSVGGDCLKLDRTDTDGNKLNDDITKTDDETKDENESSGLKRRSGDLDESIAKKLKMDENCLYHPSSSWTLWRLVWPRRKQISSEIDKGGMSVMELEAAITEKSIEVSNSRLIVKYNF